MPLCLLLLDTDPAERDPLAQISLHLGIGMWCPMFRAGTDLWALSKGQGTPWPGNPSEFPQSKGKAKKGKVKDTKR